MSVRDAIQEQFKQARRDRDTPAKNIIGMLRTKVQAILKSGKGREEDDELWKEVITAYAKQLGKTMVELEKAGERANEAKAETLFEMDFCNQFLPKKLNEADTEVLVRKLVAEAGITSPKEMGKLMGLVMKSHRDEVDGGLVRQIATRVLTP